MTGWEDSNPSTETEKEEIKYYVEKLHNVSFLAEECCDLINLEWKRSRTARMRSIANSSENFPMSLLLLQRTGPTKVVGHLKISKLSLSTTKVFVETVVIHPKLRGKGLGKFLMQECEKVCKSKNIKWIYLSTKGQEMFYEKLGYKTCPPVSMYGCQFGDSDENISEGVKPAKVGVSLNVSNKAPVPPPLPVPSKLSLSTSTNKTFMKKQIIY